MNIQDMIPSIQLAVLVLSVVVTSSCETFYVVPVNSTKRCEAEPCLTLDQLDGETANHNFSNLTLYFLPGQHFLNQHLYISNIENLNVTGYSSDTTVWLQGSKEIAKVEIVIKNNVVIENMTFFVTSKYWSGKVNISDCSNLLLVNCTFKAVELLVKSNSTTMVDCTFEESFRSSITTQIFTNHLHITHCRLSISVNIFNFTFEVPFQANISDTIFESSLYISQRNKYGKVYITNCELKDNISGDLIINNAARTIITNSTFTNNKKAPYGYHYYIIEHYSGVLEVANCLFVNNTNYVSVIAIHTGQAYILQSKLTDNNCQSVLLIMKNADSVYINESSFINNHGGAIFIPAYSQSISLIITNCEFTANYAKYGGAVYSDNANLITITNSSFINNTAEYGGAIYIQRSDCKIIDCIFKNNTALDKSIGAAIVLTVMRRSKQELP